MFTDRQACLHAINAKDPRFDGVFYTAVRTTGIYCRPSCPARTPKAENVTFYPSAAAAQLSGYRACKRCLPGASPGSPEWDIRSDTAGRAIRLINDGVVDRVGVAGLASQLGYSVRQIQRLLMDEFGAGPIALARTRRAHTARTLLQATQLPVSEIAYAAGFGSLRSCNDTIAEVYATTPTQLRNRRKQHSDGNVGELSWLTLDLAARLPWCPCNVFGHLIATSIRGVEHFQDGRYWRTMRLPAGFAVLSLAPTELGVNARIGLTDLSQLPTAISRVRRLLDLDADPVAISEVLRQDDLLRPALLPHAGRRIPRSIDGDELAIRIVLGQQVSTAAAQTHGSRLTAAVGSRVETGLPTLTHLFPTAEQILSADDSVLAFPKSRLDTLRRVALALATGELDLGVGADWATTRQRLAALKGIGPWSIEMIAMRALGEPDAFPSSDLGLIKAAKQLRIDDLVRRAERWRPWRSYATQYLWAASPHAVNSIPGFSGCQEVGA